MEYRLTQQREENRAFQTVDVQKRPCGEANMSLQEGLKKSRGCVARRRSGSLVGMRGGQEGGVCLPQKHLEIKYFTEGGGKIRVHLESPLAAKGGGLAPREETVITLV